MLIFDRAELRQPPRQTRDGYLVAVAHVARTGIQEYTGDELGRPEMKVVRVYRPPEEVFAKDSLASYAHKPVTLGHPSALVDASTWADVSKGHMGEQVARDGEFVAVPLVLMDSKAISALGDGKKPGTRELSMGYTADIVFEAGVTDAGESFDAKQTNIRINHLALVDRARGGAALRIGDDTPPSRKPPMSDNLRTVMVDGIPVATTDAGATVIDSLQRRLADAATAAAAANTAHNSALALKDAELAKLQAKLDDTASKVIDAAALDARVNARAALIATAKAIVDGDYNGKSDAEIRRAVVVAKLGDAAVKDKPQAYVDARFDILAESTSTAGATDPFRSAVRDNATRQPVNDGYAGYLAYLNGTDTNKGAN